MKHVANVRWNKLVCGLLCGGMLASMTACAQKAEPVMEQPKQLLVETKTPETGDITLNTEFIGTVEPNELVSVFPKVAGTVLRTNFTVGDTVKKGDVLFEIDPTDIQLSVNIAQAQLMSAQAQMDQALGSGFDMQMTQLESQLKQAQNAYSTARQSLRDYNDGTGDAMDEQDEGIGKLQAGLPMLEQAEQAAKDKVNAAQDAYNTAVGGGVASSDEIQAARDALETAKTVKAAATAKLNTAESQLSLMRANYNELDDDDGATHSQLRAAVRNSQTAYDAANQIYELTKDDVHSDAIKVANASLGAATAAFEAQARQLDYTSVISPIDGVIEQKNVTEQAIASQSSPAFTVSNKSTLMVTFYVPSDAVEQMSLGDEVTIEYGQKTCTGTLAEIGSMVDPASGLFKVKAAADTDDPALLTGLAVKITARTAKAESELLLPQSALYYEDGNAYVYLLEDSHAVKTPIEVGISNQDMVEVLSGISADAKIIATWHPNLADGVEVTLAESTDLPSSASEAASAVSNAEATTSEQASSDGQQED